MAPSQVVTNRNYFVCECVQHGLYTTTCWWCHLNPVMVYLRWKCCHEVPTIVWHSVQILIWFFFFFWAHLSGSWPTSRLCHYVAAIKCWLCAKRRVVFHTSHCFVLYCRFPTQCLNKELLSVSFTPSCLFNKKTGEQTQAATRFNEFDGLIKHLWHTFAY